MEKIQIAISDVAYRTALADLLRQCSPFAGVLDEATRLKIFGEFALEGRQPG